MDALTLADVLGWVRDLGALAVLTLIVMGAIAKEPWWISGALHRRMMADREAEFQRERSDRTESFERVLIERDAFRDELFDTLRLASRAAQVADRATVAALQQEVPRHEASSARLAAERETRRLGRRNDTDGGG